LNVTNCEFINNPGQIPFMLTGMTTAGSIYFVNNQAINFNTQVYLASTLGTISYNSFYNVSSQGDVFLYIDQIGAQGPYTVQQNTVRTGALQVMACYYFDSLPSDPSLNPAVPYSVYNNTCLPVSSASPMVNYGIMYHSLVDCQRVDFHNLWANNNNTIIQAARFNTFCQSTTGTNEGCPKYCTPYNGSPPICYIDSSLPVTDPDYGYNTFPSLMDIESYCQTVYLKQNDEISETFILTNPQLNITSFGSGYFNITLEGSLQFNATNVTFSNIQFINPNPATNVSNLITFGNPVQSVIINSCTFTNFTGGLFLATFNCDGYAGDCQFRVTNSVIQGSNGTMFEITDTSTQNIVLDVIMDHNIFDNISGTILDTNGIPNLEIIGNSCLGYCLCDPSSGCTDYALIIARMIAAPGQVITITGNSFENSGDTSFYDLFSTYSPIWINGPFYPASNTQIYDNSCHNFPVCIRATNLDPNSWLSNTRPQGRVQTLNTTSSNTEYMREWLFYNSNMTSLYVDMYIVDPVNQHYYMNDPSEQCTDYCIDNTGTVYCLVTNQTQAGNSFTFTSVQDAITRCPFVKDGLLSVMIQPDTQPYWVSVISNPQAFATLEISPYNASTISLDLHLNNHFSGLVLNDVILPYGIPTDASIVYMNITDSTITGGYTAQGISSVLITGSNLSGGVSITDGLGPVQISNTIIASGVNIITSDVLTFTSNVATCIGVCKFAGASQAGITNNQFYITLNNGTVLPRPGVSITGTSPGSNFTITGNSLSGDARVGLLLSLIQSYLTSDNATSYASGVSNSNSLVGDVYDIILIYGNGTVTCNGNCDGVSTSSIYGNTMAFVVGVAIIYILVLLFVMRCGVYELFAGVHDAEIKLKLAEEFRVNNELGHLAQISNYSSKFSSGENRRRVNKL